MDQREKMHNITCTPSEVSVQSSLGSHVVWNIFSRYDLESNQSIHAPKFLKIVVQVIVIDKWNQAAPDFD